MDKIIIIGGPTASGKTALSYEISKKFDVEIISADSMQIYKYMDIGTAKASIEFRNEVRHHFVDIVRPDEKYDVNTFSIECDKVIKDIISRGKIPLIVGGTGFYIQSILFGLPEITYVDEENRRYLEKLAEDRGNLFLHDLLKEKWPERAQDLHPNDIRRIIRSLEIFHAGKVDDFYKINKEKERYKNIFFYIDTDRELLRNRVKSRVKEMVYSGLLDEVKFILKKTGFTAQAANGIGYRETIEYINSNKSNIENLIDSISVHTNQFIKRQRTFFKNKFEKMIFIKICDINKYNINEKIKTFLLEG